MMSICYNIDIAIDTDYRPLMSKNTIEAKDQKV